ncbi:MAG: class I SAM-dependent methyltransferase [Sedimentisphaerales bacterium]|jgi:ubiquinone/menaquinone biosynthesis C-methylase UbiE
MPSAEQKQQINESKASRFDFGLIAGSYDSWYAGRRGAMYDRLEKKLIGNFLPAKAKGKKLLDVGCGTGHWSRFFSEYGFEVTGLDISERMIGIAKSRNISNASFQVADGHSLPFPDETFNATAAITTLEFVRDTDAVLQEMIRCTRKSGRILLGVLNALSKVNRQRANSPESPYAAAHFFSPVELKEFLEPYGQVEITVGGFVPAQSWLIPFAPWFDCVAGMFGSQKGAFIAALLKL